jgi:lyso-ornithine lipid O-acyltransferase
MQKDSSIKRQTNDRIGSVQSSVRTGLTVLHVCFGLVMVGFLSVFRLHEHPIKAALNCYFHRRLCRILNVRVEVVGAPVSGAALYVANHISWLDVPVLGGLHHVHFLSKAEVRPLIGRLTTGCGTLFIQRGAHDTDNTNQQIANYISAGKNVLIFPEGTTSDGTQLRRFHSRLLESARNINHPLQPVALRYIKNGELHDVVPFIGEQTFAQSFFAVIKEREIIAQVTFLPPVNSTSDKRSVLSKQLREDIQQVVHAGLTL